MTEVMAASSRTRRITVTSVPFRAYAERLASRLPIRFVKRTHGIWDHLALLVTGALEREGHRRMDQMIFKCAMPDSAWVMERRLDYVRYLRDILADITAGPTSGAGALTISMSLDYITRRLRHPTIEMPVRTDARLLRYWQTEYCYCELFDRCGLWEQQWQYAQMPALGVVTQEILRLPAVARTYHVVVYGPEKLRDLGARWNLAPSRFTFVPAPKWPDARPNGSIFTDPVLPALTTYSERYRTLQALSTAGCGRPRLFLFEAGTVSQWLIPRLAAEHPGDSFLDLGRALELWFPDQLWPLKSRIATFFRRAARNFYGVPRYMELRARLARERCRRSL